MGRGDLSGCPCTEVQAHAKTVWFRVVAWGDTHAISDANKVSI